MNFIDIDPPVAIHHEVTLTPDAHAALRAIQQATGTDTSPCPKRSCSTDTRGEARVVCVAS